jgi:hypothetical protein
MTKLNIAHAPNAERQVRSVEVNSLACIDRLFGNVPCIAALLWCADDFGDRQAPSDGAPHAVERDRFPWLAGFQWSQSPSCMSNFSLRPPWLCADACPVICMVAAEVVLHFDCDDAEECSAPLHFA